jgi:hypothetical protein
MPSKCTSIFFFSGDIYFISIISFDEKTKGLFDIVCGEIGVKTNPSKSGDRIGPPADSEYAVDPFGVDNISPSAAKVFK